MAERTVDLDGNQVDWRELSGAGEHTPPGFEQSRSEGDLNRNRFRRSRYPRLSQVAVGNDDGTPITAATDALLRELTALAEGIREARSTVTAIQEQTAKGVDQNGDTRSLLMDDRGRAVVRGKIWVSRQVQIPYGATSGALDANDALGDKFTFDTSVDGEPLPKSGRILSIRRIDPDDDTLADTIHVFNTDFVAAASDAAFTIAAGDALNHVTSQTFPTGTDLGGAKSAEITDINSDYYSAERRLVCQASTTGTPNIAHAGVMPIVQIFVLPLE